MLHICRRCSVPVNLLAELLKSPRSKQYRVVYLMQSAAAPAAPPPPRPRRVYTAVDPRCEWARTEDADILAVDVSGFRKEELKVLYNTSRKLKVTGESQVDGARWARFLKVFPVPRSCDADAIRAMMDKENSLLYVILPKGSSSSSMYKQKEQQPGSSQPQEADGGDDANAVKKDDGDGKSKRWWKKIRPLHALGFVLILALVGVGACVLYAMSL